jgi:telomerase reverse transcriptase
MLKIMMYMFPRQFGLHNVFTSQVDFSKTSQKFQDYTLREDEIAPAFQPKPGQTGIQMPKIPKRLRGDLEQLVERLQTRHGRCSYVELLRHYCPCVFDRPHRTRKPKMEKDFISSHKPKQSQLVSTASRRRRAFSQKPPEKVWADTQLPALPECKSLVDLATPTSQVSAFCQAVLSKIIPHKFWGDEDVQKHNESMIMRKIDHFVELRRFETMSLHEMSQNLKVGNLLDSWLHLADHARSQI